MAEIAVLNLVESISLVTFLIAELIANLSSGVSSVPLAISWRFQILARSLLQAEALYQLFGIASSEPISGDYSFFQDVYRELNSARSFTQTFVNHFTHIWFIPLAMHPANYKHYYLMNRGWNIYKLWISDWLINKENVIVKIMEYLNNI